MSFIAIICGADERRALHALLSALNVEAQYFDSAELYLQHPMQSAPICVLASVRLPGMSGLELLRRLRLDKFAVPVILLAADGDVRTAVEAMRLGATDFIEKPQWDIALMRRIPELIRAHSLRVTTHS